jgi:hypothetical protein
MHCGRHTASGSSRRGRRALFPCIAAAAALSVSLAGTRAEADDWKLALEDDGITVYTRASEASDNLAFRGI